VTTATTLADWLRRHDGGVAITGASGWIGGCMAHVAIEAMAEARAGRLRLFGSRARAVEIAGRGVTIEPLKGAGALGGGPWLVLHMAVAGSDREPDPRALRALNEAMLADALALASAGDVRRLIAASSGAVSQTAPASLDKQAYNDLKRDQEQIARAWSAKAGVPLLMPRIFNVGGPYMTQAHNYALGSFIRQAQAGGVIDIGARRPVWRSYVHGLELARVTFALALDDDAPATFDTAGGRIVELSDLAKAVGRALALPDLQIRRAPMEAGPEDRYVGDGGVYQATLARMGAAPIDLDRIIRDTAAWLAA
jgi:nucleoside-diphosphate-sugar epimerase